MEIELLEDMPNPNTPGKTWRKGQVVDPSKEFAEQLIREGKAKAWTPPLPDIEPKKPGTKRKR